MLMYYSESYARDIKRNLNAIDLRELDGKSILITGATGLIGSALVDVISLYCAMNQVSVCILAAVRDRDRAKRRFAGSWGEKYINLIQYDACYPISFSVNADYIIHTASNAHPQAYEAEPVETMLANINGVQYLLEYARKYKSKRFLYISSSEVYGKKTNNGLYREDEYGYVNLLNPRSCYPSSKRAAETLCAAYYAEYGVNHVIVRPGHVYGPTQTEADSRASAQFLRAAARGENIVMKSPGLQQRSYCHCFDCATAILMVLLRGETGEAYNISNSDSIITIREYAEICAQLVDRQILFEIPSMNEEKNYNLMNCSALDSVKLEKLGWHGLWNAEEGIGETIRILRYRNSDSR